LSYSLLIYFIKCVKAGEEVYGTNIWCGVQLMLRMHELDQITLNAHRYIWIHRMSVRGTQEQISGDKRWSVPGGYTPGDIWWTCPGRWRIITRNTM